VTQSPTAEGSSDQVAVVVERLLDLVPPAVLRDIRRGVWPNDRHGRAVRRVHSVLTQPPFYGMTPTLAEASVQLLEEACSQWERLAATSYGDVLPHVAHFLDVSAVLLRTATDPSIKGWMQSKWYDHLYEVGVPFVILVPTRPAKVVILEHRNATVDEYTRFYASAYNSQAVFPVQLWKPRIVEAPDIEGTLLWQRLRRATPVHLLTLLAFAYKYAQFLGSGKQHVHYGHQLDLTKWLFDHLSDEDVAQTSAFVPTSLRSVWEELVHVTWQAFRLRTIFRVTDAEQQRLGDKLRYASLRMQQEDWETAHRKIDEVAVLAEVCHVPTLL